MGSDKWLTVSDLRGLTRGLMGFKFPEDTEGGCRQKVLSGFGIS